MKRVIAIVALILFSNMIITPAFADEYEQPTNGWGSDWTGGGG